MARIWFSKAHRTAEVVATAMFAAIFVLFLFAVFMRYAVGKPLAWPDELNMVLLLWTTFLTEALVLAEREQVTFDAVYDVAGPELRRVIGLTASVCIFLMFLLAFPTVYGYVTFLWRERTNVLEWRLDWVFSCFVVYWIAVMVRAVAKFVVLCGKNWQENVTAAPPDERTNVLG